MIFNTFNNDAEKWTSKIGMFGKSFDELRNSVNNSFKEIIDNIDNFDKDVSFWESLKNNLAPKDDSGKSFIRNSLGEIISQDNIDSYIKELDISSAKDIQKEILSIAEDVNAGNITWDDYFEIQEKTNNKYINETIKNTKDLSKLTADDLVQANQKARSNVIAHNNALNQQTLSAKASKLALQGLALAGNMLVSMGISLVVSKAIDYFTELANTVNNTREAAEGFSSSISEYNSNLSKNKSSLNDLNTRYKELSKGVGTFGQNLTLSTSEYEEYKDIISQVSDIMPDLALRYNEQGEKIGFVKNKLCDLNEEYKKYQQNDALELVINGDESGNTIQDVLDDYNLKNDGNLGIVSGGTTWGQWIANAFKEVFTLGHADTFDTTYTADYVKRVLEQVRDTENREEATTLLSTFTGDMDADEERKTFGKSMSEIKNLNDDEFKEWQVDLNGYIQRYESQIVTTNNRVRESMGIMAKSFDEYWSEDVSDDERTAVSSFLSNMTDDMLTQFEDGNGKISQGALNNFLSSFIQSISTDQELFTAYESLMSEGFKNMPYAEASEALNGWISKIADKTGFDKNQIAEMFGLDGYANYLINSNPEVVDYDIKSKLEETFVDENGKTVDVYEQIDNMSFDQLLKAYEVIQNVGDGEKITWEKLLNQMSLVDETSDEVVASLENYKSASKCISFLSSAFKELSDNGYLSIDTISQIKESVSDSIPNWDEYEKKLLSVQKGTDEYNQIMSDLTYASLENQLGGVEALANASEEYVTALLRENDVLNANEVAHNSIERAKTKEYVQSQKNDNITDANISGLIVEASAAGISKNAYLELTAQEILFNNNQINTNTKCEQILAIANAANIATTSMTALESEIATVAGKKIGSGERTKYAQSKGVKVIAEKDRTDGKKNGNLYVVGGEEFDDFTEAMYYAEAYNTNQKISNSLSTITLPDYSGNDTATQTKESFNWIETALSRIQRTITNLGKTVSATYKSWGERNSALAQQMSATSQEISLQTDAYNKYMSLANGVSLSENYKSLVRTGAIRYDDESLDSNTAEKIREYQEFYESALAASDAITDLEAEQANLIQTKFDNIAKRYDDQLLVIEHEANSLNSSIEMIEKQGHVVSEGLYQSLIQNANQQMSLLQTKYNELQSAMSGVVYGSEMWYSLNLQLLSIQEEMDSLNSSTIDWNNAIQDLKWENFDRMLKDMAAVNSEADFLMELMSDEDMYNEDGSITDAGRATMGLHAVNYNSKMAQASEIAKELQSLDADFSNDKENLTYLERRNELEEQYRNLILDAKDDQQALIDMQKDQYDALLDHMSKVIDKRKNMLSQAKDAYDYEKTITEQAEEVSKLEKQLSAYQNDTSEESRATIQQLKVSLEDAKENLEETQYEKYISDQEQMLDALYDETEEWINTRLDDEALLLESILSAINENAGSIRDTLANTAYSAGTTLSGGISEYLNPSDVLSETVEQNTLLAEYRAALENISSQLQFNVPSLSTYTTSLPANSSVNNITINGLSLDFPNVQTPEEWVTYLQHDKRFENIILEITDGLNNLSKYKW